MSSKIHCHGSKIIILLVLCLNLICKFRISSLSYQTNFKSRCIRVNVYFEVSNVLNSVSMFYL